MEAIKAPDSLMEAIQYFSNPEMCVMFMAQLRWTDGPVCPRCAAKRLSFLKTRLMWKCLECQKQFTVKVGTIFEDSAIGINKWLCAMWLIGNCKNGVSSYEIGRDLKVTQKSAWFMLHRIRYAMRTRTFAKLSGELEVDESFIGGEARNMHAANRARVITGTGGKDKAIVMGMDARGTSKRARRSLAMSLKSYEGLDAYYQRTVINHAVELRQRKRSYQHDEKLLQPG